MALTVALALRTKNRRPVLAVSAATGLVIGVGVGFRMDVAITVPVAFAAIWLFRGRFPWTSLLEKAAATIALALSLLVSAGPVLYRMSSGGSNAFHAVLLGYADEFDARLGVVPSVYRFLPFYDDKYLEAAVNAFGGTGHGRALRISSAEYDAASRKLWFDILKRFPGDVFTRVLAATNSVLNLAFAASPPSFLSREVPAQDYLVKASAWLHSWNGWGGMAGAVFVLVAAFVSLRQGLLAVLFIMVLAGYPSLQFGSRHYFHLQVIPVFVLLVLFRAVTVALRSITRSAASRRRVRVWFDSGALPCVARRLAFAIAVPVLTILLLWALRQYQSKQVHALISEFLNQTRIPIHQELLQQTSELWVARWPDGAGSIPGSKYFGYYVLEFRPESAHSSPIVIGLRYRSFSPDTEFSRLLSVASGGGIARLGFAVFGEVGQWEFEGIELGPNAARRLTAIYRMPSGGPGGLPLDLMLPPNWSDTGLFQRLALESPSDSELDPRVLLVTTGQPSNSERTARFDRLLSDDVMDAPSVAVTEKNVHITPTSISMDYRADSEFSYLVQFKATDLDAGTALIAEGRVERGGIAIGLLKDNAWYSQVIVRERGRFAAVLPVSRAGTYVPMITNAMPDGERRNRFQVTRLEFTTAVANSSSDRTQPKTAR